MKRYIEEFKVKRNIELRRLEKEKNKELTRKATKNINVALLNFYLLLDLDNYFATIFKHSFH